MSAICCVRFRVLKAINLHQEQYWWAKPRGAAIRHIHPGYWEGDRSPQQTLTIAASESSMCLHYLPSSSPGRILCIAFYFISFFSKLKSLIMSVGDAQVTFLSVNCKRNWKSKSLAFTLERNDSYNGKQPYIEMVFHTYWTAEKECHI